MVKGVLPGENGRLEATEFVVREVMPLRLPSLVKERGDGRKEVSGRNRGKTRPSGENSRSGEGIYTLITRDAHMARHPAKAN